MEINNRINNLLSKRVLLHVLFWVVYISADVFIDQGQSDLRTEFFRELISLPLELIPAYTAMYFILPLVLDKKHFLMAGLVFIGLMIVTVGYTYTEFFRQMHNVLEVPFYPWPFSKKVLTLLYYNVAGPAIPVTIKLVKRWYIQQQEKSRLQLENTEAKLHLLRSQVNPHFLFNSLNNIASLAHISADKTRESIIMLSELMRYMVYDGNRQEVLLSDELNYILNYISLQKIRIDQENFVEITKSGEFNNHKITPMLLIPLVENAFKYCDKQSSPGIWINYRIEDDIFNFNLINTINKQKYREALPSGFGIRNVKNRLQLLYRDRFSLQLVDKSDFYNVTLQITLARNEKNSLHSC